VDSGRAATQQVDALRSRVGHTQLHDSPWIGSAAIHLRRQFERQRRTASDRQTFYRGGIRNRHDSRNDGHLNACIPCPLDELPVMAIVKEQLRNEKIKACVDLPLEVIQIHGRIAAFDMLFGIRRAAHTDALAMRLANECC